MTLNLENIRKMMGWCPKMSQNNFSVSYTNSGYSTIHDDTNSSTFSPFFLKNTYVAGSVKKIVIVIGIIIILILAVGALYFNLKDNSIFLYYVIELILFFMVLMNFAIFRSNVEINSKCIRISTMMQWILGLTTYSLDSINTVKVQKNKSYRLWYWSSFILGTLWLFLFLSDIFAGKTAPELIHSFFWVYFCFSHGYIIRIASKSVYHIRISFDPNPSINHLKINTKDAPQIADMIAKAKRFSGDIGVGGAK